MPPFRTSNPRIEAVLAVSREPRRETVGMTPSARAIDRQRTRCPKPTVGPAAARNSTRITGGSANAMSVERHLSIGLPSPARRTWDRPQRHDPLFSAGFLECRPSMRHLRAAKCFHLRVPAHLIGEIAATSRVTHCVVRFGARIVLTKTNSICGISIKASREVPDYLPDTKQRSSRPQPVARTPGSFQGGTEQWHLFQSSATSRPQTPRRT